ncbi:MAG: hypothetical protein RL438_662 [Actinomycetota bacterium]
MNQSLTELPNIGKAIASDLEKIGIVSHSDLEKCEPLAVFNELKTDTLLSVRHYFETGESLPWWEFTEQGKKNLKNNSK